MVGLPARSWVNLPYHVKRQGDPTSGEPCDLIFPDTDSIQVRDKLIEQNTGKPPECRVSKASLVQREEFKRFSMAHLQDVDAYLKDIAHESETEMEQENAKPKEKNCEFVCGDYSSPPPFKYFHML
jgi:hypothetical protein